LQCRYIENVCPIHSEYAPGRRERDMSNKGMIIRECERLNAARRVFEGRVDSASFFRRIRGDLEKPEIGQWYLICFAAVWREMICRQLS
jgi:hypothetical protein